jgi:hypothetical protein
VVGDNSGAENGMPNVLDNRREFCHGGISDKNQEKHQADIFDETELKTNYGIGIVLRGVVFV